MIFNKRTINTSSQLSFCLAVCRIIKVGYISLLVSVLLYTSHSLFDYLTINAVVLLSISSFIILSVIHIMSHIKDISMRSEGFLQEEPIIASIWDIYRADGVELFDKLNEQ